MKKGMISKGGGGLNRRNIPGQRSWTCRIIDYLKDKPELAAQLCRKPGPNLEALAAGLASDDPDWIRRFCAEFVRRA